ncbi:threonine ammonia-lyase [Streptomyces bohaiensis]|uniref:threonine ammonia-lyase n=1 Tax=Streptomyces bohaiensis TaxID=1431344 RepID=UPI003B7BDBD8
MTAPPAELPPVPVPEPADVARAAQRLRGLVRRTPLLPVPGVPGLLLKAEHLQLGGSFKARGAANAIAAGAVDSVVTGSSGNHGIALATLALPRGLSTTVVMAEGASPLKADRVRELGADVVTVAGGVADRERHARLLAARTGALLVPSSDDPRVVAGQGTVALEVLHDLPSLELLFVPTGGGGLLAGCCLAAELVGRRRPVRIIGVEPMDARRYALSLAAGHPVQVPPSRTVADGLRGQRPGAVTFPVVRRRTDELIAVEDDEILAATELLHRGGVPAEPSGAVALAGALRRGFHGRAAVVVSGGNISFAALPARGAPAAAGALSSPSLGVTGETAVHPSTEPNLWSTR